MANADACERLFVEGKDMAPNFKESHVMRVWPYPCAYMCSHMADPTRVDTMGNRFRYLRLHLDFDGREHHQKYI